MTTIEIIIIVCGLAAIALGSMFYAASTASEVKENKTRPIQKFEAGKISYPHCVDSTEAEKPKRKKKRYYNKKKPAVANNATNVKRPVGRPKKSN